MKIMARKRDVSYSSCIYKCDSRDSWFEFHVTKSGGVSLTIRGAEKASKARAGEFVEAQVFIGADELHRLGPQLACLFSPARKHKPVLKRRRDSTHPNNTRTRL